MIDKNKQYRTRDGREVRIYATDGDDNMPIHGAILNKHGWRVTSWTPDGLSEGVGVEGSDLIEVKPRIQREVWLNVYPNDARLWTLWFTKKQANRHAERGRIACVKITIDCEEGEGL